MLAEDPDEAAHQAEEFLKDKPLSAYYDEVAIAGLALAQLDVNRGALGHEQRVRIKAAVEGVIDNLADHAPAPVPRDGAAVIPLVFSPDELALPWREMAVLCVAGRGSLDEASAAMLAQLLQKHGIGARVVPSDAVSAPNLFGLDVTGVQMAFLCYLEPGSFSNPRYLVRAVAAQAAQGDDCRGVLDTEDGRDRGAERTHGHGRRSRRRLLATSGRAGTRRGTSGR